MAMVKAFNSLAQLVTKEILAEECVRKRADITAAYIKVSPHLLDEQEVCKHVCVLSEIVAPLP